VGLRSIDHVPPRPAQALEPAEAADSPQQQPQQQSPGQQRHREGDQGSEARPQHLARLAERFPHRLQEAAAGRPLARIADLQPGLRDAAAHFGQPRTRGVEFFLCLRISALGLDQLADFALRLPSKASRRCASASLPRKRASVSTICLDKSSA
jgi:hypothetical protein